MTLTEDMARELASLDSTLIVLVAACVAFTAAFVLALWALKRTGVPVYSAAPWTVKNAIDLLALKDGERFCDLGCGLGRPLRSARRHADVTAVGYELNPFAVLFLWAMGVTDWRVHVRWRDFRNADLSSFDAVYLYLVPHVLPTLAQQLERQLKPGTRVVSVDFPIPGWKSVDSRERGQKAWLYVMGRHLLAEGEAPDEGPTAEELFRQMMEKAEAGKGEAAAPAPKVASEDGAPESAATSAASGDDAKESPSEVPGADLDAGAQVAESSEGKSESVQGSAFPEGQAAGGDAVPPEGRETPAGE